MIGLGGTFDHFHVGHAHFLEFAAAHDPILHVGIVPQSLVKAKAFAELIEPFAKRKAAVEKFLELSQIKFETSQLNDVYGPTITAESNVTSLAVTEFTVAGAEAINKERMRVGLAPLPVYVCKMRRDIFHEVISSTRIRGGVIDRIGGVYVSVLSRDLRLGKSSRKFFSKRQGEVVTKPTGGEKRLRCVVGDVVLEQFLKEGWTYDIGVFDRRSERTQYTSKILDKVKPDLTVENAAGMISLKLRETLQKAIVEQRKNGEGVNVLVDGEEDLAAVALVLLTPLETRIYYGHRGEGMVEMIVTEELKHQFYHQLIADEGRSRNSPPR